MPFTKFYSILPMGYIVDFAHAALPFFHLFLSPHLGRVSFYTDPFLSNISSDASWAQLAVLVRIISVLPTSLENLSVTCGTGKEGPLDDAISPLACRCGTSLRGFQVCVPSSETAIRHLTQLPNLRTWYTVQEPPRIIPASNFPSLQRLHLGTHAAMP